VVGHNTLSGMSCTAQAAPAWPGRPCGADVAGGHRRPVGPIHLRPATPAPGRGAGLRL